MNKMLVCHVHWLNCNESYNLFPSYLKNFDDVKLIDLSEISREYLLTLIDESSILIIDHSIFAASVHVKSTPNVKIKKFRGQKHYKILLEVLFNSSKKKIYIASGWDLHWTSIENEKNYLESCDAIAWLFEKTPTKKEDLRPHLLDDWMKDHQCPSVNWHKVRQILPSRFEITHALDGIKRQGHPIWDISVCGVSYAPRRIVKKKVIKDDSICLAPFEKISVLSSFIPSKHLNILFRKKMQSFILNHSRVNFVCGSAYNYPVRKFFEVAQEGSLLLALPFNGFEDFGFKNDHNCVVANLDDIDLQIKSLIKDRAYCTSLIENLHKDIYELHNIRVQCERFIEFAKYVYEGKKVISEFIKGTFQHKVENSMVNMESKLK